MRCSIQWNYFFRKSCFFYNQYVYSRATWITVYANNEKGLESLDVELYSQFGFDPPWVSNGMKTDKSN